MEAFLVVLTTVLVILLAKKGTKTRCAFCGYRYPYHSEGCGYSRR